MNVFRFRPSLAPRLLLPVQEFIRTEAGSGAALLAATALALMWANSPWKDSYFGFWDTIITVDLGIFNVKEDLQRWVNDGLMVVFFFVVGLEVKRELLHGELAGARRAALPVAAAAGGMAAPALIYTAFNAGGGAGNGWAIPMATDIAFALGVLALLGPRIPSSVRVFLLALAIVDDIGAILVIAVFYSASVDWGALVFAAGVAVFIAAMLRLRVRNGIMYGIAGLVLWAAVFESGVQATIAGVVLGLLTPSRPEGDSEFARRTEDLLAEYRAATAAGDTNRVEAVLGEMEEETAERSTPLERLERLLHPWSSYLVVPVFALANAGIDLSGGVLGDALTGRVTLGVLAGLLAGKLIGVFGATFLAVRLRVAELPPGVTWMHVAGIGLLAGIGFTVALFVTGLAFEQRQLIDDGKVGILAASTLAGAAGFLFLRLISEPVRVEEAERVA
jgi:NhaA family Na+:H+ antiporter